MPEAPVKSMAKLNYPFLLIEATSSAKLVVIPITTSPESRVPLVNGQRFINNRAKIAREFKDATTTKLAIFGQDRASLIDCTEALPDVVGKMVSNTAR